MGMVKALDSQSLGSRAWCTFWPAHLKLFIHGNVFQRGIGCHFDAKLQMMSTLSINNQPKSQHLGPQHPSCLQQESNLCTLQQQLWVYTRGFSTAFMRNIGHFSWATCHQDHDQALLFSIKVAWQCESKPAFSVFYSSFVPLLFLLCFLFSIFRREPFAFANGSLLQASLCDITCYILQ